MRKFVKANIVNLIMDGANCWEFKQWQLQKQGSQSQWNINLSTIFFKAETAL